MHAPHDQGITSYFHSKQEEQDPDEYGYDL